MALVNYSPFISFNKPLPAHFSRKLSLVCPLDMPLTLGLRTCQPQKVQNACEPLTTKLAHFLEKKKKKPDRAVGRNTSSQTLHSEKEPRPGLRTWWSFRANGTIISLYFLLYVHLLQRDGNINSACFVAVLRLNSTGVTSAKQGLFHCIYIYKELFIWGWRVGSVAESMCCPSRGPVLHTSQHPCQVTYRRL